MAKESKRKSSKTEKSLTASKAFKGIENVIERVVDKLPSNVSVDVAALTQMAAAGGATYIFSKEILKALFAMVVHWSVDPDKADQAPDILKILFQPGSLYGWMLEDWFGYSPWSGVSYSSEQLEEIRNKIAAFEPTEEQRVGLSLLVAALLPQTGAILAALAAALEGLVPG